MPVLDSRSEIQANLLFFTQYCFEANNKQFVLNWHHRIIANALMRVFIGSTKRLIINMPPRYTKTELAVVNFMAWAMGHNPDCEFIHASYSKRLATNNAYNCRALVMSQAYRDIFPDVELMDDSKAKDEWRTSSGGVVYATGSDGTITGYGAGKLRPGFGGCVLIDDPHKAGEAESELRRSNVINWFQTTIESRLNSPDTPIIVVMQRLHEEDLSGWLLAGNNGEQWEHLAIPIMDEDDKPLWPSKHSFDTLERMRQASPYVFAGQYMQSPAPRDGGMIKRDWLAHNRFIMPPATPLRIVQSWDTAFKSADINDPSVCTTWAETPAGYYLLDVFVVRGDYPTVKRCIINKYEQLKPSTVLIEDKASGQSLIQDLRTSTRIPIIAISPVADKISRMYTASAAFESGRVFLPEVADWLMAYEAELFVFPKSKHDDQVDSTSQFINWVNRGYNSAPAARAPQRNWG